jgi:hypothetical protein
MQIFNFFLLFAHLQYFLVVFKINQLSFEGRKHECLCLISLAVMCVCAILFIKCCQFFKKMKNFLCILKFC